MKKAALRRKTARITELLEAAFGEPRWNGRKDPLESLIQTILSQNTNDRNRDRAFRNLKTNFPTWEEVLHAPVQQIHSAIRVGGLGNQKSRRIKDILRWLKEERGKLSLDFICEMSTAEVYETLSPLKGVGLKTISVVLLFACGRDVFPVDTHVHRTTRRLGLVHTKASARGTHHVMSELVPRGKSLSLHLNLIHLGRTTCKPGKPQHSTCPLKRNCNYYRLTTSEGSPS